VHHGNDLCVIGEALVDDSVVALNQFAEYTLFEFRDDAARFRNASS